MGREDADIDPDDAFVVATVAPNKELLITSEVVGWVYFLCWTFSFYPQVWTNYRRKSVIGLSFDLIALNLTGFTSYSVFNCFLYWNKDIQNEYFTRHPGGQIPVLLNDVIFAAHAAAISLVAAFQCMVYERGDQKISTVIKGVICLYGVIFIIFGILSLFQTIQWLTFLYICSYVKLSTTLIKYIPQAMMNYKRKSTSGWSIKSVILDFTGGLLSMAQMIINADNYDDWVSTFGNPTKFGLGLFSVCFDTFFLIQHYILYRVPSAKSSEKPV